jgi:hypothetical protein
MAVGLKKQSPRIARCTGFEAASRFFDDFS